MFKKIISALLSAALILGVAYVPTFAAGEDEKVTLIVETEGAPLLATKNAVRIGASEFMKTAEAKNTEAKLLSAQAEVKSDIKRRTGVSADKGFTYTSVLNGFSMEARESDIEKIKSIDGVKNVYISQAASIPTPISGEDGEPSLSAQMMNVQAMYDNGFDGRGQAVAIIDAGFDVVHEFFSSPIESPRLSKSYVKDLIENNELNAKAEANQVYKNAKIPFAYDYGDNNADVYYPQLSHGTHVAGIAAGKNGVFEGTTFSGVAPEAQLILMKIADSEGSTYNSIIIAAMDDAAKMDVCAVNLSLGSTMANSPAYTTACDNLRNAGIAVVSAAGNDDRYPETAENPDYSYVDYPAGCSASTSVASCDTDKRWLVGGGITLSDGEKLVVDQEVYSELFFKKFSDKFYDYVYVGSETTPPEEVVKGKIVISVLNSGITSRYLLDCGAIGMIFVENDEIDGRLHTVSDEKIPGLVVRKSYGEKLINADDKRFKTDAEICTLYKEFPDAGISYFSNWATGSNLELKPEITAPGGNILSSVNGDMYENNNGTSMAAPHITGAMALMSGFVDAEYPDVSGADKVALMENIMMSSASIMFSDDAKTLPLSPRKQGAGLANLDDALTIPVILKGDSGKSKLSLGDMLGDEITLKFTAENLTDSPVTYDDISVCALTDGYENVNGENLISDSVPLEITAVQKPEEVTIPAKDTRDIEIKITLNSAQTAANKQIFTNGFWVDGYINLSSKDGSVTKASMPYTGFYGDWTAFDAFSPSYFEEGGSAANGYIGYNSNVLGTNLFVSSDEDKSEYESESYVGISDLTDTGYRIRVRMLRALVDTTLTVKDSGGNVVYEKKLNDGLCRQIESYDYFENISLNGLGLPEGDYTAVLSGKFVYGGKSRTEEKTYKFYIDSEQPKISNPRIYEEGGKKYAAFEASDNRYLMGAIAVDAAGIMVSAPVKAEQQAEITLDITDMDESTLSFSVYDYAYNSYTFTIGAVTAQITDSIINGGSVAFIASVTNTAEDADADVIMALYDADGRLIDAQSQNKFIKSGEQEQFTFGFTDAAHAENAELFVWKHGDMTPLCGPCVFPEYPNE